MQGIMAQVAAVADSLSAQAASGASPHGSTANEVVVENPVPGFVGQLFQFFFNTPKWVQWGGIVLGMIVAAIIAWQLYLRRDAISGWLSAKSKGYKMGLVAIGGVMLLGAAGAGYAGNNYMTHNNDFCVGCHVMGDAWGAFAKSEHRKLECHDCHRQSKVASMRQLYFWIAEKPQDIPKHAKVPTAICSECHVRSEADSGWKRIIATAGHRLHMKSDSASLKEVACVTCHGQEVHRFKPVDQTCGQSGCHAKKDTEIRLGKMAGQTSQHCTGCHTFTRPVPENLSMDSTRKYLVASGTVGSCYGCHQMKDKMKGLEPKDDVGHQAVCGTCHNPHQQTEPRQAYETCASSGCHSDLGTKSRFHVGLKAHKDAPCGQCHTPHSWKPISTTCEGCHTTGSDGRPTSPPRITMPAPSVRGAASGSSASDDATESPYTSPHASSYASPPAPPHLQPIAWQRPAARVHNVRQTTLQGRRTSGVRPTRRDARRADRPVARRVMRQQQGAAQAPAQAQLPKDSPKFSHQKHKLLQCGSCHDQKKSPGALTVRGPTGCASCHHSPERTVSCEGCHNPRSARAAQFTRTFTKPVMAHVNASAPPKQRLLPFAHLEHRDLDCKGCHTEGVMLSVKRDCQSCHAEHHTPERTCLSCHQPPKSVHVRAAHDGCAGSGCHSNAAVLALPTSRSTCLVCHADQVKHKPKRECAECHAVSWSPVANPPR